MAFRSPRPYRFYLIDEDGEMDESPVKNRTVGRELVKIYRLRGKMVWLLTAIEYAIYLKEDN